MDNRPDAGKRAANKYKGNWGKPRNKPTDWLGKDYPYVYDSWMGTTDASGRLAGTPPDDAPVTTTTTGTGGGGGGYGYGYGGGGGGITDAEARLKALKMWAKEQGYKPSPIMLKLAVKNEWSITLFAKQAKIRDTNQWLKSDEGKKEARSIAEVYRQWFPTWNPTRGFLKGLYKMAKGTTISASDVEAYIRTRPEFKDIYRYYNVDTSGFNVKSSPETYRRYMDSFRNIYRSYMGEYAPESEIKFFFESRGLTPEDYEANLQKVLSTKGGYEFWENKPVTTDIFHAAAYNRKGGAQWRSILEEAAIKREKYMQGKQATFGTRMDETGKVRSYGV
jgi:hypothetical protein